MRQGGSIGGNAKKCRETCRHPLRRIVRVIRPQRTIFEPSAVEFDCGHEGHSYGSHRGRCKKCPPREGEDGLLVWGRELPSRWCGHGEDGSPAARYVVRRSNDTGLWSATAPDGTRLASSTRTAAIAKDACQRYYTNNGAGARVEGR